LQAYCAGYIENRARTELGLGKEPAPEAEPKRQQQALREDGEENNGERAMPKRCGYGIEIGMERGVARIEVAVGKKAVKYGGGFRQIVRRNVSAWCDMSCEEDNEVESEAAKEKRR
jgi:hypothetical protein